MRTLNGWDWLAIILLAIGGLNWGLIGLFNFNLVAAIFGGFSALTRLIYILVGLAALYTLFASPVYVRRTQYAAARDARDDDDDIRTTPRSR